MNSISEIFEGEVRKGRGKGTNRSKTYMGGWYKEPETAREEAGLQTIKAAVKILKPDSEITLGEYVGEHETFTKQGWDILLGLAGLVRDGYLTKAQVEDLIRQRKEDAVKLKKEAEAKAKEAEAKAKEAEAKAKEAGTKAKK